MAPAQFEKSGAGAGALVIWNGAWTGAAGAARKLQEMMRNGGGAVLVVPDASAAAEFNRAFRILATGAAEDQCRRGGTRAPPRGRLHAADRRADGSPDLQPVPRAALGVVLDRPLSTGTRAWRSGRRLK